MKKIILILSLIVSYSEAHADSWDSLVKGLTSNRAEIETLSKEIDSIQREKQADLDQWVMRKTELQAQVEKEKLRQLQLDEKLKRLQSRVKNDSKTDPQAQKKLIHWIASFKSTVKDSIPFAQTERLETLERLEARVKKAHEPMEYILADLWAFIEDELKLASSNEYKIIDIKINNKKRKSEVARLGLMSLFAVTPDGKIYKASKTDNKWVWSDIHSGKEQESVLALVKNLKNKNETGIYQLPINELKMGASL